MKLISRATLQKHRRKVAMPANLDLRRQLREIGQDQDGYRIYEFVGTDTFGSQWNERRTYEVEAGRAEEPLVYQPIYDEVVDATLPKNVSINRMGPGGVIFEEVKEGGEVKFSSVESAEVTVPIRHWATGLEYSKDLVVFNELWSVAIQERAMGIAYNALLNHLHLSPILTATYTGDNQTAFNTAGASAAEDYMLTLEDAITNSRNDATNPRRGPYILLVSPVNLFTWERALTRVPQQGFTQQTSAIDVVGTIVAYDGWTGTRGKKTVTYPGVTANKAYLINTQYRGQDFQSYVKQTLEQSVPETDITRFLTQIVWDSYLGVYANPLAAVEEITLG